MDYTVITKEQADLIRGFVADDIYEGFAENNRFAVCATRENVLCGVGVFDAKMFMEIVDIVVLPQYRGKLEGKLLNIIMGTFAGLPCEAVKMDVYEGPETEELKKALVDNGFKETGKSILYRFNMKDMYNNPRFGNVSDTEGIYSLFEVSDRAKKVFSNMLIQKGLYSNFLSEDISDTLSTVYLQDDRIMGCVLVQIMDEASFYVEFVYVDERAKKHALPAMLRESAGAVAAYYQETGADGFILATNETARDLVDKTLPNAYIVDVYTTYIN